MNISILSNGSAEYKWVKKLVSKKEASIITQNPSYHAIKQNEYGAVVAFKRLVETDNPLPEHLQLCDDYETEKLVALTTPEYLQKKDEALNVSNNP